MAADVTTFQQGDSLHALSRKLLGRLNFFMGGLPTPPAPPTPTVNLDLSSVGAGVGIINWDPTVSDSTEIWKSINGGAYYLLTTVASSLGNVGDPQGGPVGQVFSYKARQVTNNVYSAFSNVVSMTDAVNLVSFSAAYNSTLQIVLGLISASSGSYGASVSFPALLGAGSIGLPVNAALTTLSLPNLGIVNGDFDFHGNTNLATLNISNLNQVAGNFNGNSCKYSSLNLPNLSQVIGMFTATGMSTLTSINLDSISLNNNQNVSLNGNALPSAMINYFLHLMVNQGAISGCTFNLNGGTNGAPTGQGITDKTTLIGEGNTVTTN
jgi:hypothetical protein